MAKAKSEKLYHSIGEVSRMVGVEPHVLRYWESEFRELRPKRSRSGSRAYRKEDIETIREIKRLLHVEKYTLEGAKEKLKDSRRSRRRNARVEDYRALVSELRNEIREILALLEG